MNDYDLYNGLPPHQSHSDTSRAAAESIQPKVLVMRMRVLNFIATRGSRGATDDEVHVALGIDKNTTAPRRRELQLKGQVVDSGYRRRTRAGKYATVWVASGLPGFMPGPHIPIKQLLKDALRKIDILEAENRELKRRVCLDRREA